MIRRLLAGASVLVLSQAAMAQSTIDPTKPAANSALTSKIIRDQFTAAYNDINALNNLATNVAQFGAKSDNVTDDTVAVNTGIAWLCARGGGKLFFPRGTTIVDNVTTGTCSGLHFEGAGKTATTVKAKTNTAITFGNGTTTTFDLSMRDMTVAGAAVPAGSLVHVTGVNGFTAKDFTLVNYQTGFLLDGGTTGNPSVGVNIDRGYIVNGTPTTGVGIDINNALGYMRNVNITGGLGTQPLAGILVRNSGGFWIVDSDVILSGIELLIQPINSDKVQFLWVEGGSFDTGANGGIVIAPQNTALVGGVVFTNTETTSSGLLSAPTVAKSGVLVSPAPGATVDGVSFVAHRSMNNSGDGITINGGTNISVDGGSIIGGNNWVTGHANSGVVVNAGSHISIRNSRIGPTAGFSQQHAASIALAGAADYIDVSNNDLNGDTASLVNLSSGTHNRVQANIGYNPVGVTGSTTIGASPATICAGPSSETHYLRQSATNTATVSIGGTVIGTMTSATTPIVTQLGPNECEVVTWATTAPTYTKSVH